MPRSTLRMLGLALVLCLQGYAPRSGTADDVPAAAKKDVDEARALLAKGDAKSLSAAYSAVSRAKAKAADSVDFWELFARVWRANKKPEAELWDKLIAPREQQNPSSITFDLVRARLEVEPAKRVEHLEKAIAKDAKAVAPRLLLVAHWRANGDEAKAEELLEKVLVDHPTNADALVAKTELLVEGGLSRTAVDFAKEALAKQECPPLRYALALALRKLAQDDESLRPQALAEAQKAVDADPQPRFVLTLVDLLDESGKSVEAVALLKKHAERTKDTALLARLGALAFRAGDYDTAAPSLTAAPAEDLLAAKMLGYAHARRGRTKEALAVAARVVAAQPDAWPWAARVAVLVGDLTKARGFLGAQDDPFATWLRAWLLAEEGKVAEVSALVGKDAASGTRAGEDMLLVLVHARLMAKLADKAAVARKQVLEARWKVAGSVVPEAQGLTEPLDATVHTQGYMARAVSYLRSACGNSFTPQGQTIIPSQKDGKLMVGFGIIARAECERDTTRAVRFNAQTAGDGGNIQVTLPGNEEDWKVAEAAFVEGCAALVADDAAKAATSFGTAAEKEPNWHRAKLLRALASAFVAGGDVAAAAKDALAAADAVADDWEARGVAIALAQLAGIDVAEALSKLQRHKEERSPRRAAQL